MQCSPKPHQRAYTFNLVRRDPLHPPRAYHNTIIVLRAVAILHVISFTGADQHGGQSTAFTNDSHRKNKVRSSCETSLPPFMVWWACGKRGLMSRGLPYLANPQTQSTTFK